MQQLTEEQSKCVNWYRNHTSRVKIEKACPVCSSANIGDSVHKLVCGDCGASTKSFIGSLGGIPKRDGRCC